MADQPNAGGPGSAVPVQVRIVGQYVKDLSFESPNVVKFMTSQPENPNLNLELNVVPSKVGADVYESALSFKAQATSKAGIIYDLEVEYAGLFEIKGAPPEMLDQMLHINCPSMLFPFLRRLTGDLTCEGGFPPLFLDPVDFAALYFKKREQLAKSPTSSKPS